MIIRSVLVAQALEGVFLVLAHQDAATADGRKFLLEDVCALSLLLSISHCFYRVADCGLLLREGMGG